MGREEVVGTGQYIALRRRPSTGPKGLSNPRSHQANYQTPPQNIWNLSRIFESFSLASRNNFSCASTFVVNIEKLLTVSDDTNGIKSGHMLNTKKKGVVLRAL